MEGELWRKLRNCHATHGRVVSLSLSLSLFLPFFLLWLVARWGHSKSLHGEEEEKDAGRRPRPRRRAPLAHCSPASGLPLATIAFRTGTKSVPNSFPYDPHPPTHHATRPKEKAIKSKWNYKKKTPSPWVPAITSYYSHCSTHFFLLPISSVNYCRTARPACCYAVVDDCIKRIPAKTPVRHVVRLHRLSIFIHFSRQYSCFRCLRRLTEFECRKNTVFYALGGADCWRKKKADLTFANIWVVAKVDRKDRQDRRI